MRWTWKLDRWCSCNHCQGKSKHTWAFFYYLKRMGDDPLLHVHGDVVSITIERKIAMAKYPAEFTAHWPSGPINCCPRHAEGISSMGEIMGIHVMIGLAPDGAECTNCRNEAEKDG